MSGHNVGYIRVSSVDQNTARQLEGVYLDNVFEEKASAKDTKRPELQACIDYLRKGDVLHVHSIDRLARNLVDLQNIITDLNGRDVVVRFHKENLAFDGNNNAMSKLMLQMMGAFAEFERNLIKERQREGIAVAMKKGIRFGRKAKLNQDQISEIRERVKAGEEKKAIATEYGVSRPTLYKALGGQR